MKINFVYKWMGILGLTFFTISLVELIFSIILNSVIIMNLNGEIYSIGLLIFSSGNMPIHAVLIEIILITSNITFLLLGAVLYFVSKKKVMKDSILAKFILLIGLFLILGGFFKLTFLVFLGKTTINTSTISITFQDAIYTQSITPLFGAFIWMYYVGAICCFLISGLIFGAVGLKWILRLQELASNNK